MPRHTVHRTKPPHVPFEELSPKGQASRLKKRQQSRNSYNTNNIKNRRKRGSAWDRMEQDHDSTSALSPEK